MTHPTAYDKAKAFAAQLGPEYTIAYTPAQDFAEVRYVGKDGYTVAQFGRCPSISVCCNVIWLVEPDAPPECDRRREGPPETQGVEA